MQGTSGMKCSDAEVVNLLDDPEESYLGNIRLGISDDEYVYFENQPDIYKSSSPENNFELWIKGYFGEILLPRHILLEIHTDRVICGKIASPTVIFSGDDMLELEIEKNLSLELCLETRGSLILNNIEHFPDKEIDGRITYGRKIDDLVRKYIDQTYIGRRAAGTDEDLRPEYPLESSTKYQDTCKCYNIVMIRKSGGIAKIMYEEDDNIERNISCGMFRDNIRFLRRALKKSVLGEDYKSAIRIRDKIFTNEMRIKEFGKRVEKKQTIQDKEKDLTDIYNNKIQ